MTTGPILSGSDETVLFLTSFIMSCLSKISGVDLSTSVSFGVMYSFFSWFRRGGRVEIREKRR